MNARQFRYFSFVCIYEQKPGSVNKRCDNVSCFCRPEVCNFIKQETQAQVFSCEFCKICKNTFFIGHLRTTAPVSCMMLSYSYDIRIIEVNNNYNKNTYSKSQTLTSKLNSWRQWILTFRCSYFHMDKRINYTFIAPKVLIFESL